MRIALLGRAKPRRTLVSLLAVGLIAGLSGLTTGPGAAAPAADRVAQAGVNPAATASGFLFYKYPLGQPNCSLNPVGLNVSAKPVYTREDCGFANFTLSEAVPADKVKAELYAQGADTPFATLPVAHRGAATAKTYRTTIAPPQDDTWNPGEVRMVIVADGEPAGEAPFGYNLLAASVNVVPGEYEPGQDVPITGRIFEVDTDASGAPTQKNVPAKFEVQILDPTGAVLGSLPEQTAGTDGSYNATIPGAMTRNVEAGPETDYQQTLGIVVADATYQDPTNGMFAADRAGSSAVTLSTPPSGLILENSFVSAVGWVKPGETYPSRVLLRNLTAGAISNASVTVTAAPGSVFTQVSAGTIATGGKTITWNAGSVAASSVKTLVIESRAFGLVRDPQIVWKDLSSKAKLTVAGTLKGTEVSHGPRVIPQATTYDTARFGDRPFPVVPVDYRDRKHQSTNSGDELAGKINSASIAGSTFNLFQEMSLGQLFPQGTIPSAGIATADFGDKEYDFTSLDPQGTCKGTTTPELKDTPLYPERIQDGFYQLPGDTEYYGGDKFGSAVVGSQVPGPLFDIDSACGPTGKMVFDAATIADPETDYSDYDTDKDGVVDFFMVVYAGCGGNGASQLSTLGCPYDTVPYDNIWPHSSSLEFYYTDDETGQTGYVSDDQLKNLEGEPLFYTDTSRTTMTTNSASGIKVFVRVGPYNVNPETAIDKASVISHEYGHSLGLPDFYSLGGRETYGDWNLMATDKSHNMDVFSRQEMGWIVPEVLKPGTSPTVTGWSDSKEDTHEIHWQTADGTPYTLSGPRVHNAMSFVAKLPGRQLISPDKFDTGDKASKTHAWWSGSGNDFGCPPSSGEGGHNLDVVIPGAGDLPVGTDLRLEFKSLWDIEWDFDYGFVLSSIDGGESYVSSKSNKGYTTPLTNNPQQNACQARYGNGITGSSGSYQQGTQDIDRVTGDYPPSVFLADSYDITELSGVDNGVLRFSYSTDPGLARPGWYIDDIKVTAVMPDGEEVLLDTDLEDDAEGGPDAPSFFNGGCKDDTSTASQCTPGWNYIASDAEAPADHAYYLEMRDRSGFDESGMGESDRDPIAFAPGLSMVYTDEAHGYGNTGVDNPPAQSPLDSQPQPGNDVPDLNDAAWTAATGDKLFSDFGKGHVDNYSNPEEMQAEGDVAHPWRFAYNCLSFDVLRMAGDDIGPSAQFSGNLNGDVKFTMGNGCGAFDYGYVEAGGGTDPEPPGNAAPRASATVNPKVGDESSSFTFDARGSTDAETPDDLDYSWNFNDGGVTKDAVGPLVQHEFTAPGVYTAKVTVTDPRGGTDVASVVVHVTQTVQCANDAVRREGGWRHVNSSTAQLNHYCINNGDKATEGDSLSMSFTGPRVALAYGKRDNGGSAVVFIDGTRKGTISFHNSSAQPRFGFLTEYANLGRGTHTVQLVVAAPKPGYKFAYMDSFRVAGKAMAPPR